MVVGWSSSKDDGGASLDVVNDEENVEEEDVEEEIALINLFAEFHQC